MFSPYTFLVGFICIFQAHVLLAKDEVVPSNCDVSITNWQKTGCLGQTASFPWLGILRVHSHNGKELKIGLTGLLLVKDKYAIGNADDLVKIPHKVLIHDSQAMFIPSENEPWQCKVKKIITHPEYEFSTYNTIALVELNTKDKDDFPLRSICWPQYNYKATPLYAVGYTDENELLEKTVYGVQYVNKTLCEEFYHRAGLIDSKSSPTHYQCAYAENNKENCVWENGMVLASNSTGPWMAIGFGVRGPGCGAPSRFIELLPYLPWIDSATDHRYEIDDYSDDYRRAL